MSTPPTTKSGEPETPQARPSQRNPRHRSPSSLSVLFEIPTNQTEQNHVHTVHGRHSKRAKILKILHSNAVEYTLMGLLILDVMILFVELYLSAEFPSCHIVERDGISCCPDDDHDTGHLRWLGEAAHEDLCETHGTYEYHDSTVACDEHKHQGIHTAHVVLRSLTMIILSLFELELCLLIISMGIGKFLSHFFYVFDWVVVTISLAIEIVFLVVDQNEYEIIVALIILGRLWRFVRIGHGIFATTYELTVKHKEQLHKEYTQQLEQLLKANGIDLPPKQENTSQHA